MAKITKATQGGRTIYKIAGTSKYALTLAKAKEIAAKVSGAKRTTAKKRTSTAFTRSYESGTTGRRIARTARKARTPQAVVAMFKDMKALEEFYFDLKDMGAEALHEIGVAGDAAFARRVRTAAKARLDELDRDSAHAAKIFRHLQPKAGRKPAVKKAKKTASRLKKPARVTKAYAPPAPKASRRSAKGGKKYARQSTGRALYRTPKLIGRAYTNRYGERVGPTRILGRTVDYAMKIVRTKGRGLKATPEHRKEIVSKYRKALQKAGFLRGAATRSNSGRTMQYFKEVVCEGGHGGGGCGSPLAIHKITQETFEAARGPKRSNAWFEHHEDEGPEVDGPFKVVLGHRLCRDCRE